jgi:hypothetical protein
VFLLPFDDKDNEEIGLSWATNELLHWPFSKFHDLTDISNPADIKKWWSESNSNAETMWVCPSNSLYNLNSLF